jgi:L-fuconate dehydratase
LGRLNEVGRAARRGWHPVCPHAGGIGLCEYGQHVSLIDYICVSGSVENRMLEFADHLHEHFLDPIVIRAGRYMPPTVPGFSIEMRPHSLDEFEWPTGEACAEFARRAAICLAS